MTVLRAITLEGTRHDDCLYARVFVDVTGSVSAWSVAVGLQGHEHVYLDIPVSPVGSDQLGLGMSSGCHSMACGVCPSNLSWSVRGCP